MLFPVRATGGMQNAVNVLLDCIVLTELLLSLPYSVYSASFSAVRRLYSALSLPDQGACRKRRTLSMPCSGFKEDDFTFMPTQIFFFVTGFLVFVVQRFQLFVGGDVLNEQRHIGQAAFHIFERRRSLRSFSPCRAAFSTQSAYWLCRSDRGIPLFGRRVSDFQSLPNAHSADCWALMLFSISIRSDTPLRSGFGSLVMTLPLIRSAMASSVYASPASCSSEAFLSGSAEKYTCRA